MGLIRDAFNDIAKKKETKEKQESKDPYLPTPKKSDLERLHELKAEIEQKIAAETPKEPEKLPEIEVPLETRLQVLEHNINVVINDLHDRITAIEQFLIRNYNQENVKKE